MTEFSDYVIYADESGDHSLTHIDAGYPVFVLCLCIFQKSTYIRSVVPRIQQLKFKWFGHDAVILHEKEIRKRERPFEFLNNAEYQAQFIDDLSDILRKADMRIVAAAIDKRRLVSEQLFHENPYHVALSFCMEKLMQFMARASQLEKTTHFIFEKRGQKEDNDLELEFRRICDGHNATRRKLPNFEIKFLDKKANSSGMQLADLTARPIGLHVIRPQQANRAYDIIQQKLIRSGSDSPTARGLKIFP